jgi:hypothetical protein
MMDIAEAEMQLRRLKSELAAVQDRMAGPRMEWRRVVNEMSDEVFGRDYDNERLTFWRPLGAGRIAALDESRARYLDRMGDLPERERILKAAVRAAEIELNAAIRAEKANRKDKAA